MLIFLALSVYSYGDTPDEIAKKAINDSTFVAWHNGTDRSPEGERKTILANSEFSLSVFMVGDEVPERIRIAYALGVLKRGLRVKVGNVKGNPPVLEWDEAETKKRRVRIANQISILEKRFIELTMNSSANK